MSRFMETHRGCIIADRLTGAPQSASTHLLLYGNFKHTEEESETRRWKSSSEEERVTTEPNANHSDRVNSYSLSVNITAAGISNSSSQGAKLSKYRVSLEHSLIKAY